MVLLNCGRVGRRRFFIQQKLALVSRAFLFSAPSLHPVSFPFLLPASPCPLRPIPATLWRPHLLRYCKN